MQNVLAFSIGVRYHFSWSAPESRTIHYISSTITISNHPNFLNYKTITHTLERPIPKRKKISSPIVIDYSPDNTVPLTASNHHTVSPPHPPPGKIVPISLLVPNQSRKKHIISVCAQLPSHNTTTENEYHKNIPWEGKNGVSVKCNELTPLDLGKSLIVMSPSHINDFADKTRIFSIFHSRWQW